MERDSALVSGSAPLSPFREGDAERIEEGDIQTESEKVERQISNKEMGEMPLSC